MGTVVHDTMVITGRSYYFDELNDKIEELFSDTIISYVKPQINGVFTITIGSCGSKLGWTKQEEHTQRLNLLENYLLNKPAYYLWTRLNMSHEYGTIIKSSSNDENQEE